MLERLDIEKWLEYNALLQQKKNEVRKALKEKGVLQKGGTNSFDKYKYFTEAQYKELFTELFATYGLELNFNEIEYVSFDGTDKQSNGRQPKIMFYLYDCDTGFYETTTITGEGIDKGDKAGYKAYTGALKYFLADKFMVATGDDPETDSPMVNAKPQKAYKAKPEDVATLKKLYNDEEQKKIVEYHKIKTIDDLDPVSTMQYIQKRGGNL